MNEVTKIHLGRQAFNISIDAHHELKQYLDDIKRHVHEEGIVNEIELRMVELLNERGVVGDKVILPADVSFLKEQLGEPKDFAEEDEEQVSEQEKPAETKKLFRDTDNAMLAGVAAGLANYFNVDVLLIRLLFVIVTFMGGWGILLYLVLWVLVPETKTPSDRLQMAGKAVTIESLKEIVERADVKSAARRANNSLSGPINVIFRTLLKAIGVIITVFGLATLMALCGSVIYMFLHNGNILQDSVFPIGFKEHLLVYIAAAVIGFIGLFIVLLGLAIFRRKWPIHMWVTGSLIGLMLICVATGAALTADVVPQVRDQYNANVHTTARQLKPFTKIELDEFAGNVDISYEYSPTYSVTLQYYGHPDLSSVKTTVTNGVLTIDTQNFNWNRNCQDLCIPKSYNLSFTVYSPTQPTSLYSGNYAPQSPIDTPTVPLPQHP